MRGRVFTTTTYGNSEFALALDENSGERLWATRVGAAVQENTLMRWLSQRTPTIDGDRVYVFSNTGCLVCLDATTGSEHWRVSYPHDFGTPQGRWGFCDRPLIDGDTVICTPGGSKATSVALNKRTGKVIWSKLLDSRESAAYGSCLRIETDGLKQFVVFLEKGIVSFAADDGRFLWRYESVSSGIANSYTPLVVDGGLLCPNGYHGGMARLRLTRRDNEIVVEEQYLQKVNLDPFEDSTVLVEDRLYAFGFGGVPLCLNVKDGTRGGAAVRGAGRGKAAATYADGHLYARWTDGALALLSTNTSEYVEKGRFTLPEPRNSVGATFPVVAGGHLYVRDNDRLYCFDVRQHPPATLLPKPSLVVLSPPKDVDAKLRPPGERVPNAIFVPTPQDVVEKILAAAKVGKDDVVYDLGSGDGRIVIEAARKSQCRAVGLELDRDLVTLSRERVSDAKLEKLVTIKEADLFDADFSEATVVTVYLYPGLLKRLLPQFEKLKPGTRIVSHQFEIPDFPAETKLTVESQETGAKHSVYLWTTPLKK